MSIILGAYWFYGIEKPLEDERHDKMIEQHKMATASVTYLANFLSEIHYKYEFLFIFMIMK